MLAEILSTGDEILSGAVLDSNAAHIAEQLAQRGIRVSRHTSVGDDVDVLGAVIKEISTRAGIALVTGGLGPTNDDFTAQAAANAAGVGLQKNPEASASVDRFFESSGRTRALSDGKQALLPQGAVPIPNIRGTAPGFHLAIQGCRFYFLPGVPGEMRGMLADAVLPAIEEMLGVEEKPPRTRILSAFGLPEARISDHLKEIGRLFPSVRCGSLVRFPIVYIKLAPDPAPGAGSTTGNELDRAADWVSDALGEAVFSVEGRSMEEEVADILTGKGKTVAVAESCTGGLIAHMLTNVSGSSAYFLLSAVTYANRAKMDILGVSRDLIEAKGAVHEESARSMAEGVRRAAGADYGLSTSGIAGPSGGSREKPVGTVCIGIAGPERVFGERFFSSFEERLSNKQLFAVLALNMLRKELS